MYWLYYVIEARVVIAATLGELIDKNLDYYSPVYYGEVRSKWNGNGIDLWASFAKSTDMFYLF